MGQVKETMQVGNHESKAHDECLTVYNVLLKRNYIKKKICPQSYQTPPSLYTTGDFTTGSDTEGIFIRKHFRKQTSGFLQVKKRERCP